MCVYVVLEKRLELVLGHARPHLSHHLQVLTHVPPARQPQRNRPQPSPPQLLAPA